MQFGLERGKITFSLKFWKVQTCFWFITLMCFNVQ
jgi:hypothetical protein